MKRNFRVIIKTEEPLSIDFTITSHTVKTDYERVEKEEVERKLIGDLVSKGLLEKSQAVHIQHTTEGNFRNSLQTGRCIYIFEGEGAGDCTGRSIELEEIPSDLKRVELNLKEAFGDISDIQEEKVLASNFMIVYIPFDERIGDAVTLQDVEDLLDSCGFDQDYLEEFDKESGDHSGYVKLVFREDDKEEYRTWLDKNHPWHGCQRDYEEALRQERWF